MELLAAGIKHVQFGKTTCLNSICSWLILHYGNAMKSWFCDFSSCFLLIKIPRIWRRSLVVAITKLNNPSDNPMRYRVIVLLGIPIKTFRRFILARVEPIIDWLLLTEQAEFRCGRSTDDQVPMLTQDIEDKNLVKKKTGCFSWSYSSLQHYAGSWPFLDVTPPPP